MKTANPLANRDVSSRNWWPGWKEAFEKAADASDISALIHSGFSLKQMESGGETERILFYLSLADGHGHRETFAEDGKGHEWAWIPFQNTEGTKAELRQNLSEQAFKVLCTKWFKKSGFEELQWELIQPSILHGLLDFFRTTARYGHFFNVPTCKGEKEYAAAALAFAHRLVQFLWKFKEICEPRALEIFGEDGVRMFERARPQTIPIMHALGRLQELFAFREFPSFDSLMMMHDVAMAQKITIPTPNAVRLPDHIDEAVAYDCHAAWILQRFITKGKEMKRRRKQEEAQPE